MKNFVSKIFENVCYKEDIKPLKKEDLKLFKIESEEIYKNVKPKKINDLEIEICILLEKDIEDIKRKINILPDWIPIKNILLQDAIIEIENCLKPDIKKEIKKYKSPLIDEFRVLLLIIIYKIKEKKILNQCLTKERKMN